MAPRPGLVEVALSWDAIRRAIAENTVESLGRLGRFEENILVYRRFRAQVVEEWASMTDFMHNRIFGWEPRLDEAGKKFVPLPTPPFQAKQIVWRENDFPYSCEAGIEHHNVWCTQALTPDEVAKVVAQHRQGYEWQVFVNPPTLQSIPTVWHCHVFSRPRTESLQ